MSYYLASYSTSASNLRTASEQALIDIIDIATLGTEELLSIHRPCMTAVNNCS